MSSAPSTKPPCAARWSSRRAACTARIRIRASAPCWRATTKSWARAGTNAPAKRTPNRSAIRAAGERARGATAYVTLEPCNHFGRTPPCVDVLLAAGVRRVVYAIGDPNPRVNGAGARRLARRRRRPCESGLLEREAEALNAGFLMRMRAGRPFVRLKSAASLDGRTALANGASKWITSEEARADVQHWRAQSGAVLTSAATVLADDPRLDVRIEAPRQPLRVVLDRRRQVRRNARILTPPGEVLLFAAAVGTARASGAEERLGAARIERVRVTRDHLDLQARAQAARRARDQRRAGGSGPAAGRRAARGRAGRRMAAVRGAEVVRRSARNRWPRSARLTKMAAAPQFEMLECRAGRSGPAAAPAARAPNP